MIKCLEEFKLRKLKTFVGNLSEKMLRNCWKMLGNGFRVSLNNENNRENVCIRL